MTTTANGWSKIFGPALILLATAIGALYAGTAEDAGLIAVAGLLASMLVHILAAQREEKLHWGNIKNPIAIVDYGLTKKGWNLPDHLDGQYVLCRADQIQDKLKETHEQLRDSQNEIYNSIEPMPVYAIYFRYGPNHCNDSQEEHHKHVIETMEEERAKWHRRLLKEGKKDWYLAEMIQTCENGSGKFVD
jgi:hypothetical protein